jgi:hypothetical protein
MGEFEFSGAPSAPRVRQPSGAGQWFSRFTSALAAILVGGLILGFAARLYIHWSILDTMGKVNEKMKERGEGK